jgi:RNA polymerase sigma-70 factor, ECF subfamily
MANDRDIPVDQLPAVLPDPDSEEWTRLLVASGIERDDAIARLYPQLLRIARFEARRRAGRLGIDGPEIDDVAHQAASDALIAIVSKLEQFRGESRFTTWAYKFVVFEVSTKLRRHFWRAPPIAMDTEDWERLPDRFGIDPDREYERRALIDAMREAVESTLTVHQREIFVAIVLQGTPLDVVVERQGSNRNAVYKTLFDARRKLRAALAANGHLEVEEVKG